MKSLKARVVADGCGQLHGTYTPTPSPEIMRMMPTIAAHHNFEVHQVLKSLKFLHCSKKLSSILVKDLMAKMP